MSPDYLRTEIDRLSFDTGPGPAVQSFGPPVVQGGAKIQKAPDSWAGNPTNPGLFVERATGIEPATPSLGSSCSTI